MDILVLSCVQLQGRIRVVFHILVHEQKWWTKNTVLFSMSRTLYTWKIRASSVENRPNNNVTKQHVDHMWKNCMWWTEKWGRKGKILGNRNALKCLLEFYYSMYGQGQTYFWCGSIVVICSLWPTSSLTPIVRHAYDLIDPTSTNLFCAATNLSLNKNCLFRNLLEHDNLMNKSSNKSMEL